MKSDRFLPILALAALGLGAPTSSDAAPRVTVGNETVEYFDYGDRWTEGKVFLLDDVTGFDIAANEIPLGTYGGRTDMRAEATGFFRVEKIDGRWWFVDPEGYLFVATGINEIGIGKKPASQEQIDEYLGILEDNGFNVAHISVEERNYGVGDRKLEIPYCMEVMLTFFYLLDNHDGDARIWAAQPLWDDVMRESVEARAAKYLAQHKDDPWLIGYFADNEMKWRGDALDRYYDLYINNEPYEVTKRTKGAQDPVYTVDPKDFKSYGIVAEWAKTNGFEPDADGKFSQDARMRFLEFMGAQYSKLVTDAIHKVDPNHLVMGSRNIRQDGKEPGLLKGFGKHFDVISMNYYAAWPADPAVLDAWERWSGRPIFITEFSAQSWETIARKARDAWIVKTQEDRGKYYQNLMLSALQNKNCVGTLWFCFRDFGDDANYGIVNKDNVPYEAFLEYVRPINLNRYALMDTLAANPLGFDEAYDPLRNVNWSKPFDEFDYD